MRTGHKRDFARGLRARMTDAELRLWHHLRDRRLLGHKFRRQVPIGPYIADFACLQSRLVIEIDGGQHNVAVDSPRTACLHEQGFTVLRFWNNDVLGDTDAVLAAICRAPGVAPSPQPFSARGGGG